MDAATQDPSMPPHTGPFDAATQDPSMPPQDPSVPPQDPSAPLQDRASTNLVETFLLVGLLLRHQRLLWRHQGSCGGIKVACADTTGSCRRIDGSCGSTKGTRGAGAPGPRGGFLSSEAAAGRALFVAVRLFCRPFLEWGWGVPTSTCRTLRLIAAYLPSEITRIFRCSFRTPEQRLSP